MGDVFEDVEGAFDGGGGARISSRHGATPRVAESSAVPSIEYMFGILNNDLHGFHEDC